MMSLSFEPALFARFGCRVLLFGCLALGMMPASRAAAPRPDSPAATSAASPSPSPTAEASPARLIEAAGQVFLWRAGATEGQRVTPPVTLEAGDQVRTGPASRATVQFSDRSVFRLDQSSVLELRPAETVDGWKRLFLRVGALFFFDRERPARFRIETPTATSAIRGTEFLLEADAADGTTRLAVLDGAVRLTANEAGASADLGSGESAVVAPGRAPVVSRVQLPQRLVQWALYYPVVVVPEDLGPLPPAWVAALSAYRDGDVLAALERLPTEPAPAGSGAALFAAAVHLGVGRVDVAEERLGGSEPTAAAVRALRTLIAVVRGEPVSGTNEIASASEALAWSYAWQGERRLAAAWDAACVATTRAPGFGPAWVRRAELAWNLGRRREARESLAKAVELSPRCARASVLAGFIELAAGRTGAARGHFDRARELDAGLGEAWLGLGWCAASGGDVAGARENFQIAAALEPQRALLRAQLGQAFADGREDALADREFGLALQLDPNDPTAWLYRGLHEQQTHRLNASVRDLEESVARNDQRAVYRSELLLAEDRAVRGADLAVSYDAVGLEEVAARMASRAIEDDYGSFEAHLFRARTLQAREDPSRFDLRYEAARQNQLLVANLIAPPGGANLSQQLSEQDHLRALRDPRFGGSSLTEYRSSGDWEQLASVYGTLGRFGYAVDSRIESIHGERPNAARELAEVSVQARQSVGEADGLYVQAGYLRREGGDPAPRYDPESAIPGYRYHEWQSPSAYVGYDRAWTPELHTLALVSHLQDRLEVDNPEPQVLFLQQRAGVPRRLTLDPFFTSEIESEFPLTSAEVQQWWNDEAHTIIAGGGWQGGDVTSTETLARSIGGPLATPESEATYSEGRAYGYYTFRGWRPLRATAGFVFQDLTVPANPGWPPLDGTETHRSAWSPKFGLTLTPWTGGSFRAAWTEGLVGQDFATSVRLEPSEVAGFIQTRRGSVPAAAAGLLAGQRETLRGLGFDQTLPHGTYFGVAWEVLEADGDRNLGMVQNSTIVPVPDLTGQLPQTVDFREQTVSAYADQMLGERWAVGVRYAWSQADLEERFPTLPSDLPGVADLSPDVRGTLEEVQLRLTWNHEMGVYARWQSVWRHQENDGYDPALPDEQFWQHDVWVGYRFPHRRADLRLGILNLTGEDYRLNPINPVYELPRHRTLVIRFGFNF